MHLPTSVPTEISGIKMDFKVNLNHSRSHVNESVRIRTRLLTFDSPVLRFKRNNQYLDFGTNIAHLRTGKKIKFQLCLTLSKVKF
jgi:hypothetical protein